MTAKDFFSFSISRGRLMVEPDRDLHDISKITFRLSEIPQDSSSSSYTDGAQRR
jgi:hypothetical protein